MSCSRGILDMHWNRRHFLVRSTAVSAWFMGTAGSSLIGRASSAPGMLGYEFEFPCMGSTINVRWYSDDVELSQDVGKFCIAIAESWVEILSDYQQESEAMRVCADAQKGAWTDTSSELWEMIEACDRWYVLSLGAFDASLGALTSLRRKRKGATADQLERARVECGWNHVELDRENRRVRFDLPGLRFDFGAIGKGFVADKIGLELKRRGIESYNVNAAGNMALGAAPPSVSEPVQDPSGWPISLPSLLDTDIEMNRMRMEHCGIATSGNRFQNFREPAKDSSPSTLQASHIVDPSTGTGLVGDQSITIVAPTAADADACATASCVHMLRDISAWLRHLETHAPQIQLQIQYRRSDTSNVQYIVAP